MLQSIISGGQTGADYAGLRAGKSLGLDTGGYAPKGWLTERGPMPQLGSVYGLIQLDSPNYNDRTEMNVVVSDGTVIFGNPSSGSNLTHVLALSLSKPVLWLKEYQSSTAQEQFRIWVRHYKIKCLNVAGNRESKSPGIGDAVEAFLREVIPSCL